MSKGNDALGTNQPKKSLKELLGADLYEQVAAEAREALLNAGSSGRSNGSAATLGQPKDLKTPTIPEIVLEHYWGDDWPGEYPEWNRLEDWQQVELLKLKARFEAYANQARIEELSRWPHLLAWIEADRSVTVADIKDYIQPIIEIYAELIKEDKDNG